MDDSLFYPVNRFLKSIRLKMLDLYRKTWYNLKHECILPIMTFYQNVSGMHE